MRRTASHERSTVLALGARGKVDGLPFTLAGRTCVESDAGGVWNEWTVDFDNGSRAFLAEAMGDFTLLFERPLAPAFEALELGRPLPSTFVVVERGRATRIFRSGVTPPSPRSYDYADLSSATGERATLDYGNVPGRLAEVFVGSALPLTQLGLTPRAETRSFLAAPGGPLPKGLVLWLDIGDEGSLGTAHGRATFRVRGILHRSIRIERKRYTWEEYVLHSATAGLRWLVVSDGHWNLVELIEPGMVTVSKEGAQFGGVAYKPWSSGTARIEWASGELPWRTRAGDVTETHDYIHAPTMLSREESAHEIAWSRGTYMLPEAVARAFKKPAFPRPTGRAPNQPTTPKRR